MEVSKTMGDAEGHKQEETQGQPDSTQASPVPGLVHMWKPNIMSFRRGI